MLAELCLVPSVAPSTFTLKVQEPLGASEAPVRVTLLVPGAAVMVPPPQLPVMLAGLATTTPAGSVSDMLAVNVEFVPLPVLGLDTLKVSVEVPPKGIELGLNPLVSAGGAGTTGVSKTRSSSGKMPPGQVPAS